MSQINNQAVIRSKQIRGLVDSEATQKRILALLGDKVKADKFAATLINVGMDAGLVNCTPASIIKAGLQLAELNLSLNKNQGLAYIVKYKADAEAGIGYKGWLLLAKRAGIKVRSTPVYACDDFAWVSDGFDVNVNHTPNYEAVQDSNSAWIDENLKGVLVALKEDGEVIHNFVSFSKIKQLASKSPSKNSKYSPYSEWSLEMYMAKAIKYVLSKTPMTEQLATAMEIDNKDLEPINITPALANNTMIANANTQDELEEAFQTAVATNDVTAQDAIISKMADINEQKIEQQPINSAGNNMDDDDLGEDIAI